MLNLNNLYNMDCMIGMKEFPDKYFDLAIVDLYAIKPFGISYNVRKIPSICLKWNISRHKHTVDLRNMHIHSMGSQMQNQNKGDRLCFKI